MYGVYPHEVKGQAARAAEQQDCGRDSDDDDAGGRDVKRLRFARDVKVPATSKGGDTIAIPNCPTPGQMHYVRVPLGLGPGDLFEIDFPNHDHGSPTTRHTPPPGG